MPKTPNPWQTPRVILNLATYRGMQRGINQLADAIRPTLGPLPRLVLTTNARLDHPELLDNGALIARRVVQIQDRQADVGAMYLRNLLWRLHETAGDGTATAAVLFQAIYNTGLRYIVADGNAMRLRQHLEAAALFILDLLAERTLQIEGCARIARLAETICYDQELGEELGEIFDVIGPYGRLEIRSGHGQRLERQYVEGSYWDGPLFSPHMVSDAIRQRALLEAPAILISNLEVREPSELIPLMEAAIGAGSRSLLLIVKALAEPATALLLLPPNRARLLVAAVKTPGADTTSIRDFLHDLALLTGGRPFLQEAGDKLEQARPDDLGRARRAWADARRPTRRVRRRRRPARPQAAARSAGQAAGWRGDPAGWRAQPVRARSAQGANYPHRRGAARRPARWPAARRWRGAAGLYPGPGGALPRRRRAGGARGLQYPASGVRGAGPRAVPQCRLRSKCDDRPRARGWAGLRL